MTTDEIKNIIIETLSEQNAFRDLSPRAIVSMTVDMVTAILEKAQQKVNYLWTKDPVVLRSIIKNIRKIQKP
jgi:hypothetical protein